MTRRMSVLFGLLLFVGLAWACRRSANAPVDAAASARDSCSVALAAGPEQNDQDRQVARAQHEARGGAHGKQALERLGP
jgi:hypothetical protein